MLYKVAVRLICPAIVVVALAAAGSARADSPGWLAAVTCDLAGDPGDAPRARSGEAQLIELRDFAYSLRLVGNKSHTRFPTYSYVAFTFDDGPSYKTTPIVMAALEKYDIPATFFVNAVHIVGDSRGVQKNRETLRDAVRRGFHIGNHTFHHKNLAHVRPALSQREIEQSADAIEQVIGYRPYLVRFPYGVRTQSLRNYLDQEGYVEVRWNIDSSDFKIHDPRRLRQGAIQQIIDWNGGIVLFHDPKPWTAAEIGHVFDDLEAENCRRLKTSEPLLLPVSLHYFARERNGNPRPVPAAVRARTQRYVETLPTRCKARIDKSRSSQ